MALYITSHRGHLDAVQYLLEHGNSDRQLSMFESWGPWQRGQTGGLGSGPFSNGFPDPSLVNYPSWAPSGHSIPV